jgi:hypothetical protein
MFGEGYSTRKRFFELVKNKKKENKILSTQQRTSAAQENSSDKVFVKNSTSTEKNQKQSCLPFNVSFARPDTVDSILKKKNIITFRNRVCLFFFVPKTARTPSFSLSRKNQK